MKLRFLFVVLTFCCLTHTATADPIIWDYSPVTTGGSGNPFFGNFAGVPGQNLLEQFSFNTNFTLTAMDIYSDSNTGLEGMSATIRIFNDAAGSPSGLLQSFTETVTIIDNVGATAGNNRKHGS